MSSLFQKLRETDRGEWVTLLVQFIKFGLVGVSNTAVSMGIYYAVLWVDADLYMLGSILGTVVSIFNAFIWNNLFVFTGNDRCLKSTLRRLAKTYVSYGGTSALSNFLLWLEVTLGVSKVVAPILNLAITIPLNFILNKFWSFKK